MTTRHKSVDASPDVVAELLAGMASDDAEQRELSSGDARKLKVFPPRVVTALIRALGDAHQDVRIAAAESLMPAASPRAVKPLLALLPRAKENPRWVRQAEVSAILHALAASAPGDPRVITALTSTLFVPEQPYASLPAFEGLRRMGKRAKAAVSALRAVLEEPHLWLRARAHQTLIAVDGKAALHIRALFELLGLDRAEPPAGVEFILEDSLVALGRRARPLLIEAATRPDSRRAAKKLLRKLEREGRF